MVLPPNSDPLDYYRGSSFAVTPLYNAVLQKIRNGLMPVPTADAETMLILQGASGHALLPAFQAHYAVERLHEYADWITTYRLRPLKPANAMASPAGLEPATRCLEAMPLHTLWHGMRDTERNACSYRVENDRAETRCGIGPHSGWV